MIYDIYIYILQCTPKRGSGAHARNVGDGHPMYSHHIYIYMLLIFHISFQESVYTCIYIYITIYIYIYIVPDYAWIGPANGSERIASESTRLVNISRQTSATS